MANTRKMLQQITANVDESMGVRDIETQPQLSPVASEKDVGRAALRKFGRVELSRVVADPDQPRTVFDNDEIQRLAKSIQVTGQLQPINVRWREELNKWMVVTGERRFRAAQLAGLESIECQFESDDITPGEILEKQMIENLQRRALKPMDEARGYAALMQKHSCNGKEMAAKLGLSRSRISRHLALLDLPPEVQKQIEAGQIPRTSAYEISKLGNEDSQLELAERAAAGELTHGQAKRAVRQRRGKPSPRKRDRVTLQFGTLPHDVRISVSVPRNSNYHEVEEAGEAFLDEVRLRIRANIQL